MFIEKKRTMKSECWSQANRMENILYIQSWAKKKRPKNFGSQSHIFVFMSTMNFSFIYVFITFFFCNVFGCVRDLQHQYFIEFLNYYHSPSSSANSLWLFKWNISSTSSLLKLSNYCCFFVCVGWFQVNEISVWNSNRNICIKRCYSMTKYE